MKHAKVGDGCGVAALSRQTRATSGGQDCLDMWQLDPTTVAILAQGTHRAVAVMQAFFVDVRGLVHAQ